MKPISFKLKVVLIGLFIFMLHDYAGAEWRRLGEFPKEEVGNIGDGGSVIIEAPPMNQPQKEPSWKFLCESDSGKSFYDAENITYISKSTSGARVRTYLSEKYIREKLPKFCKAVQDVRSLEYLAEMNCADKTVRVLWGDFYSKDGRKLISVPLFAETEISQAEVSDALLFEALHNEICR
jgi:hypothetical protein